MKKGLLSVIITTYKRNFPIIEESIISILEQTYKEIELLIVDDNVPGSEFSAEIVEGLKKYPTVRYIKMDKNSGACAARNIGILESNGEFVGFLDDDDLWLPQKAELQIAEFADETVGLCFCKGLIFKGNDRKNTTDYYTSRNFFENPTFNDMLSVDRVGSTSQAIIRRSGFAYFGMFDSLLPARQDYEMWVRITRYGYRAVGVSQPLFMHRLHEGEQITKVPKRALDANLRLAEKYRLDFKKDKAAHFIILTTIGGLYRDCGKRAKGLGKMFHAFTLRPAYFIKLLIASFKVSERRDYSEGR